MNGRSNVMLSGLVLGPEPALPMLPPFAAVPSFPFAASSSEVLPALADASGSMFKTIAVVEYEDLVRTRHLAEQNVKYFFFRT